MKSSRGLDAWMLIVVRLGLLVPVQAATPSGQPIIAYYFNYWHAPWGGTISRSAWNRWEGRPTHLVPGKEPWRRDIATGDYVTYPQIGPYNSTDPDIVRWQVRNAKAAGIDAFAIMLWTSEFDKSPLTAQDNADSEKEWEVAQRVTVPVIEQEGFKFIIGDEMVEAVEIDRDYADGRPVPLQKKDNSPTFALADIPAPIRAELIKRGLTHKRYADLVLNAVAALRQRKDSPAYLRLDGHPVYFIPILEVYREFYSAQAGRKWPHYAQSDAPQVQKLAASLKLVEELLGERVYWFGYDGYVTWGDPTSGANPQDAVHCGSCASIWSGVVQGLVDGFGISKSFFFKSEPDSQAHLDYQSKSLRANGLDFVANLETSYDDRIIRPRPPGDAFLNPWLRRQNGETFCRNMRIFKALDPAPRFYWLSSWNATYAEGYTVEPAMTWGDDTSLDPFRYLKLLASDLTGASFKPAALPPAGKIDPLLAGELLGRDAVPVWDDLPRALAPGQAFTARLAFKNLGAAPWTQDVLLDDAGPHGQYRLALDPGWDLTRADLAPGEWISIGQTKTFQVSGKAPAKAGFALLKAGMVQEGFTGFGTAFSRPIPVR